jgi:hypothetical protein
MKLARLGARVRERWRFLALRPIKLPAVPRYLRFGVSAERDSFRLSRGTAFDRLTLTQRSFIPSERVGAELPP